MQDEPVSAALKENNRMRLTEYEFYLHHEERSANTIAKYVRDVRAYFSYLRDAKIAKESLPAWKEQLTTTHTPASVNSMPAAVNCFLEWAGLLQCKVKPLKIQHSIFSKPVRELTEAEYRRLVQAAERENNRRCRWRRRNWRQHYHQRQAADKEVNYATAKY